MTPNKLITCKQMWCKAHQQMGQGGRVNFLSKLKVFRSEQSSLPGELAATFIASLEAPKIELLYKENDATKFRVNNWHQISKGSWREHRGRSSNWRDQLPHDKGQAVFNCCHVNKIFPQTKNNNLHSLLLTDPCYFTCAQANVLYTWLRTEKFNAQRNTQVYFGQKAGQRSNCVQLMKLYVAINCKREEWILGKLFCW